MTHLKKSFNMDADLAQRVDDFLQTNPGISFTLLMNQATARWLRDPSIQVRRSARMTRRNDLGVIDNVTISARFEVITAAAMKTRTEPARSASHERQGNKNEHHLTHTTL